MRLSAYKIKLQINIQYVHSNQYIAIIKTIHVYLYAAITL